MCQKESWEAIFATTEAHSTQRDQPQRMHGPGLWMYEQKEQRVTSVPMIGVNCNLWCPGWDGKDLGGRPEQDPGYTSRPWHRYEHDPLLEGQPVKYIKHVGRYVSSSRNAAYEARGSADNALDAAQTHSRETNVECGAVIKPRCDKGVDKSSSSSGSGRARDDT